MRQLFVRTVQSLWIFFVIHFNYGIYNTGVSPKKEPKTILEQIEPTCIHHSYVGQRVCPDNLAPSLVDCLDSEHVICSPCRQAGRQAGREGSRAGERARR